MKNEIIHLLYPYLKSYFHYRYWNHIIKTMKKVNPREKKIEKLVNPIPFINKPGIAFSFDDGFRINEWYKYGRDIFGFYDVKVTFNINAFHHFENGRELTQSEIDMLLDLQSDGHEIAHHGFKHQKVEEYSKKYGLEAWLDQEIVSLFNWMDIQSHSKTKEKFKKPASFAFPHFVYNNDHIKVLVPNYFKIIRGHLKKDNMIQLNHTGFAPSICIDSNLLSNLKYIKKVIKIAKNTGKSLILTCHSILPKHINWDDYGWGKKARKAGLWRITPEALKYIIKIAKEYDMEFYTTSEIAGIASFIDKSLEKCIRKIISKENEQWILISDLIEIKELDLRNQCISKLDGIQYFINLKKLYLDNNYIKDFRLLNKLSNLEEVTLNNNPINRNINVDVVS